MRTNIEIDDVLMGQAMKAGPYQTKKDAVEAGLKLLLRQEAYREILKWEGKLKWEGDESIDWTQPAATDAPDQAQNPPTDTSTTPSTRGAPKGTASRKAVKAVKAVEPPAPPPSKKKRRAGG